MPCKNCSYSFGQHLVEPRHVPSNAEVTSEWHYTKCLYGPGEYAYDYDHPEARARLVSRHATKTRVKS